MAPSGMASRPSTAPLAKGTLVSFQRGRGTRLGVVVFHTIVVTGKPGPNRYRYAVRPCTVVGGEIETWHDCYRPIRERLHKQLTPITPAQGAEMIEARIVKAWS